MTTPLTQSVVQSPFTSITSKRGRPNHWINNHISKYNVTDNGKIKTKCKCNYCNQEYSYNCATMQKHMLRICQQIPASTRNFLKHQVSMDSSGEEPAMKRQRLSSLASTNSNASTQVNIDSNYINIPPLTTSEKTECRELLAKAIISGLVPFEFVENTFFRKLLKILRPDFVPPSADTISKIYLPAVKSDTKHKIESKLKETKSVTLGVDGSSDNNGNPIHNVLALAPEPYLLQTLRTHEEVQSSENILAHMEEPRNYILGLGDDMSVNGCTTDNENKMKRFRRLYEQKYDEPTVGCAPHAADLIAGEILKHPSVVATFKNANKLQDKLKNTRLYQFLCQKIRIMR